MALDPKLLNLVFDQLVSAARFGRRCPVTAREGVEGLPGGATSALAHAGKIKVEVYAKNWRVVQILEGPYAGMRTKEPPSPGWQPYLIIGKETARVASAEPKFAKPRPDAPARQAATRNVYRSDFKPT